MDKLVLSDLLEITRADGALIVNTEGELIKSENVENNNNVAGMLAVIVDMCKGFSSDVKIGKFKQLILKSEGGLFIIDEIENYGIVALYSKDLTKGGVIKIAMDKLQTKKE